MKRTMTRTGRVSRIAASLFTAGLLLLLTTGFPALGARKKEKILDATAASPAILAGTVFGGAGFAIRRAEVLVTRTGAGDAAPADKKQQWKTASDARGEFFLRLPSGPATYNVGVRAPGLKPQEKQVAFTADERLEQNFLLEPAMGSGK